MYPEARMIDAMKVWKLPDGKENMLAEVCTSGEYFAQEKVDGAWYQFEKTDNYSYLFSRSISKVTGLLSEKSENVPHIINALNVLPKNTTLIGEIYFPGGHSNTVTTIMGCLPEKAIERQKDTPIHYYVHDIIMYDGVNLVNASAETRYKILAKIWEKHELFNYDFLKLAECYTENIQDELARILAAGGEGIVLKKKNLPYYPGLRPAWSTVKVKTMDTTDLVCMGFCDATKEYTGKELDSWPYWEDGIPVTKPYYYGWKTAIEIGAYDDNGNLQLIGTVSSGLTDEDRARMAEFPEEYLHKVVELKCMSIDKASKTLRHPVLVRFRDDKSAKDCLISEIFS